MASKIEVTFDKAGIRKGRAALARHTRELLARALDELGWGDVEMTVLFCSENRIQQLNREFRAMDAPTDVLSFPAASDPEVLRGIPGAYLGDLAVSLAYTQRAARKAGRNFEKEVSLLLVHGALHLLGWDHDTKTRERRMWREQDRLLALCTDLALPRLELSK